MKTKNWLFLLIGLLLIMGAVAIEIGFAPFLGKLEQSFYDNPEEATSVMKDISLFISKCASPIGITMIVTYFTRRFQRSKEYDDYFSKKLEEIYKNEIDTKISNSLDNLITKKENIQHFDDSSRQKLVKNLLYTGTTYDGYCDKVISDLYANRKIYRNSTTVIVKAFIDENGIVCAKFNVQYSCSFQDVALIERTFVNEMSSNIEYIEISDPENSNLSFRYDHKDINFQSQRAHGSSFEYVNELEIPKQLSHLTTVNVKKSIVFTGLDHWINCGWINAVPSQGLTFSLHCNDDLEIKEHMIFDGTYI